MELKGRLRLIADKIPNCGILADIGTDHAYIPVYAVQNGLCSKAIAADVRKGPVEIAMRNIRQAGLEESIETRLGNGLEPLHENESDVIVIAGMGGMLIREILANGFFQAVKANLLILQPMNGIEVVREWLCKNGFVISDESLAGEGRKIYNVICASWSGVNSIPEDYRLYSGYGFINSSDPLLKEYLQKRLRKLDVIIEGMKKAENAKSDLEVIINIREKLLQKLNEL